MKRIIIISAIMAVAVACGGGGEVASDPPRSEPVSASSDSGATATARPFATVKPLPTSTPRPAPTPSAPKLGEPLVLTNTVRGVQQPFATVMVHQINDPYSSGERFDEPEPGNRQVVIEVSIRNDGDEIMDFGPVDFELSDADGFRYDRGYFSYPNPEIDYGDLLPGDTVRGFVGFEVREAAILTRVYYSPTRGNSFVAAELQ